MKRIFLFVLTNLAVMLVLTVVTRLLGVDRFLTANGLNLASLLVFSAVIGFGGATISLLMSKWMAKMSTGAQVISHASTADEQWLLDTVARLAQRAGIGMPEVAIYEGDPNAFATGAFKNDALVAVSTGLLSGMTREEVEAVLGHEVAHIANGVSELHGHVSRAMWSKYDKICEIKSITNAQNWRYWADKQLYRFNEAGEYPAHMRSVPLIDHQLAVFHAIAEGRHPAHPHALLFGGGELVANALAGYFPFKLGEREQHIQGQPAH